MNGEEAGYGGRVRRLSLPWGAKAAEVSRRAFSALLQDQFLARVAKKKPGKCLIIRKVRQISSAVVTCQGHGHCSRWPRCKVARLSRGTHRRWAEGVLEPYVAATRCRPVGGEEGRSPFFSSLFRDWAWRGAVPHHTARTVEEHGHLGDGQGERAYPPRSPPIGHAPPRAAPPGEAQAAPCPVPAGGGTAVAPPRGVGRQVPAAGPAYILPRSARARSTNRRS